MRLAYVVGDLGIPWSGTKGACVHVRCITRALAAAGHDVTCFVARAGDGPPPEGGPRVVEVRGTEPAPGPAPADRASELAGFLLNEPLARAVLAEHAVAPFAAIIERHSLWSVAGLLVRRTCGVPLLLEVNAPLPEEASRWRGLASGELAHALRAQAFAEADVVMAVSEEVAAVARREGAPADRVTVVPNGFDADQFRPERRTAARDAPPVIAFVGSLRPWHGVEILAAAFADVARRHSTARLLVVGDGPSREAVRTLAADPLLAGRVEVTGAVPHERVADLLAAADIAVAPYPAGGDFYFSPLKLYEYMGAGLPVVASDVGQVAQVITHGVTGWLVPPGDAGALADGLLALAQDFDLRRRLGATAALVAHASHRWEDVAARVAALAASCRRSEVTRGA
jgi:glycosyltransferase involved in cell wall biosynthesis